jgi:hypothetical protein
VMGWNGVTPPRRAVAFYRGSLSGEGGVIFSTKRNVFLQIRRVAGSSVPRLS